MSDSRISLDDLFALCARQNEVLKRVRNGGLSSEEALNGTQAILDGKVQTAITSSVQWQMVTDAQVIAAKNFYLKYGNSKPGFRPSDTPAPPIVELATGELLLLYAPLDSLQRTVDAYWEEAKAPKGHTKDRCKELKSDPGLLRVIPGTEFSYRVQWVIFNPTANKGKSPRWSIENATKNQLPAHTHVLMALYYFRDWVNSWNGKDSPLPNMAGLQSRRNYKSDWTDTPHIHYWDNGYQLRLATASDTADLEYYCSPTYRKI